MAARRWQAVAGALALCAAVASAAPPVPAAQVAQVPAPAGAGAAMDLTLPALDGSRFVRLADFSGRPVLLNFWGSECPPCIHEMPLLFAQAPRHPGLQFLGIAVDQRASATRFLARLQPSYPQLLATSQPEVLLRRFGNRLGALPYTVVLNARHEVCLTRLGEIDAAWVDSAAATCGAAAAPQAPQ